MKSQLALTALVALLTFPTLAFSQDFAAEADQNMAAGRYTLAALGYRKVFEITHSTAYLKKSAIAYMMLGPAGRDAAIAELRMCVQLATTIADAQESEVLLHKAEAMPPPGPGVVPVPVPGASPVPPPNPAPAPYPGSAPAPAPAPAPSPFTGAPAPAPGAYPPPAYPPPGAPPPGAQPAPGQRTTTDMNATWDANGPRANYQQTQDCAANPQQEICQRQTNVDVSSGGLKASFHQESVTAVKTPPTSTFGLSINGNFLYGTSTKNTGGTSINIIGGGAQLGLKAQLGFGPFPGAEGGGWSGFVLQPTVGFQGAGITTSGGGQTSGAGYTLLDIGGNVGLAYLSFGALDATTLKQHGWGVSGAYHLGYAQATMYIMNQSLSSGSFSQGPVLDLIFPEYNAGTAHVTQGYLEFMVLPIKDFILITIAGGASF